MAISSAVSFSCVCAAPTAAADGYETRQLKEAERLSSAGHYQEAAYILRGVQERNPNNPYVLTELGNAYMNNTADLTKGTIRGEKCFKRSIQLNPQFGRAYTKLAECFNARGDFAGGIKLASKALSVKEPDIEALKERAGAYSNLRKDKEALADIELFMKKGLTTEKVIIQRAYILENLKRFDQALTIYRSLLKKHYEDSLVFREVSCLQALHRTEEALKSLNTLIIRNKEDDTGYLSRARIYEGMGNHKEAIEDYTKAFDLQPSTTVLKERASVYEKLGRKDLAQKDLRDAEQL